MRIVYHLGAHCTDDERLIRCLWKNREKLELQGIGVPTPTRYRALLRDTAITLKGRAASHDTQEQVLDQIMDLPDTERLILSWDNFLSYPQWVVRDNRLYPVAAERIRAFAKIFPEIEAEFFMAIRNPATFLPALFQRQRGKSYEEFIADCDPHDLSWSRLVQDIATLNPETPLTIWCDEDTPLIWPEVLAAVSGHAPGTMLDDSDELLANLMSADGLSRMQSYLASHPPANITQRRRVVSAFLDKFALPDRIETEFELPGWTQDMVDDMTEQYAEDVATIRNFPGVRFISA